MCIFVQCYLFLQKCFEKKQKLTSFRTAPQIGTEFSHENLTISIEYHFLQKLMSYPEF
jgi:hypothetical protein